MKGSGRDVLMSEILSARLEQFVANEHLYISHLIQDRNQDRFKELALGTLSSDSFYVLMDYWANSIVLRPM